MNFQDLFARYREMGVMEPQSHEEQSFVRSQNLVANLWTIASDPLDQSVDLPSRNDNVGSKEYNIMFKIPSLNSCQPFLLSMDKENGGCMSEDEEMENLMRSSRSHLQDWNLGFLKNNSLCKDYYKLTSNFFRALVVGIKEMADGEVSPAWQVSQGMTTYQKQRKYSDMFIQDANSDKTPEKVTREVLDESKQYPKGVREDGGSLSTKTFLPSMELPNREDVFKRSKDMVCISDLRKWIWGQLVPNTCLGEIRQDGEKKIKVIQEPCMKVMNVVGSALCADIHNNASPEIPFKLPPQLENFGGDVEQILHVLDDLGPKIAVTYTKPARTVRFTNNHNLIKEDDLQAASKDTSSTEERSGGSKINIVLGKDGGGDQDARIASMKGNHEDLDLEKHQSIRRHNDCALKIETKEPQQLGRKSHVIKEARSPLGNCLTNFKGEVESPSHSPKISLRRSVVESSLGVSIEREVRQVGENQRQKSGMRQKQSTLPQRSKTSYKSWCVVGGFTTRSQTISKNPPKPNKRSQSYLEPK